MGTAIVRGAAAKVPVWLLLATAVTFKPLRPVTTTYMDAQRAFKGLRVRFELNLSPWQ